MASRDLWESRAPVVDSTPTRKTWRSSKIIVPDAFQENKGKKETAATQREQYSASTEATRAVIEYDTALRHPVFFASSMVSSAAYVHPAAIGYVARLATSPEEAQKSSQLWASSSSIEVQVPSSASLWSKQRLAEKHSSSPWAPPVKDTAVRKTTKDLPPLILPPLPSTSVWHPKVSTVSIAQHWLHATALRTTCVSPTITEQSPLSMFANTFLEESPAPSRSETVSEASALPAPGRSSLWTAPLQSNTISGSQGNSLWVPLRTKHRLKRNPRQQSAYPRSAHPPIDARQRQVEVAKVESTELWRPKRGLSESPKDWLRSRATKVDFRY